MGDMLITPTENQLYRTTSTGFLFVFKRPPKRTEIRLFNQHFFTLLVVACLKNEIMNEKKIILFERYDGVRFVLERSLSNYRNNITIFSSYLKHEITNKIENEEVDLLITELSKISPDGLEISYFARKRSPDLKIIWITVLGCHVFREQKEEIGNIVCIEKPLEIKNIRKYVLQALEIPR